VELRTDWEPVEELDRDRRFREIFEAAAVGLGVADLGGRLVDTNSALARMLGYTRAELRGMAVQELTYPDEREESGGLFRSLVAGERDSYELEKRYVRKDGSVFWVRLHVALVRDEHGRPELIVASVEDIDVRKRAEEERRLADQRYQTLVEQLPLVTYIDALDDVSSNIYTSPQLEPLLGYTVEEWTSDPELFVKVLHPDDRERVLAEIARAHATGEAFVGEYRLISKDGRAVWFRDESVKICDAAGRPLYAQGYLLDITERKRAEEELRETTQTLTALIHASPAAIAGFDRYGRVMLWNPAAERMFGWTEDDALGRFNPFVPEEKREEFLAYLDAVLAGESWHDVELERRRKDGTPILLSASSGPLRDASDEVIGMVSVLFDISDRKRAEAIIRESERRFRTLIENLPGAVYRCAFDTDWTMEFLSDDIEEITGYPASDFVGNAVRTYASIIHPDDAPLVERTADEAVRSRSPFVVEYRIVRADGAERWLFERGQPAFGENGSVLWLDGVVFDVTDRKLAEQALRETTATLETLFAASPLPIIAFDLEGNVRRWNHAATELFGWLEEEVLGRPNPIVRNGAEREQFLRGLELAARGKSWRHVEAHRWRKDGSAVEVSISSAPLRDAGGAVTGMVAVIADVTDRRRAEETHARLAAVVEASADGIFSLSLDGIVQTWNAGAESIYGYPAAEIVGQPISMVIPPDRLGELELLERVRSGERIEGFETVRLRKDGELISVSLSLSPIRDTAGDVVAISSIVRDITERTKSVEERERLLAAEQAARAEAEAAREQLTEQNEQLRELDRMKDEFIALVSHELRTPLTSILGYLELILEGEVGELVDEQRHFLAVIDRNARRLLRLVGDLLFVAQIEAGKLSLDCGLVDLRALVEESVEGFRPRATERGLELVLELERLPAITGDHTRLGQLLDNLLSNAIKFTPADGKVTVRLGARGEAVLVEVVDTGVGIPAEELEHLFQRFYRTTRATKDAVQGTGLGLAISKAIAEAHGGSIHVTSTEGEGTTFSVELPVDYSPRSADTELEVKA
jgi:PAS domain S-box-containing protein